MTFVRKTPGIFPYSLCRECHIVCGNGYKWLVKLSLLRRCASGLVYRPKYTWSVYHLSTCIYVSVHGSSGETLKVRKLIWVVAHAISDKISCTDTILGKKRNAAYYTYIIYGVSFTNLSRTICHGVGTNSWFIGPLGFPCYHCYRTKLIVQFTTVLSILTSHHYTMTSWTRTV